MQHLAIVMPAHNEAEGLPSFLRDIREHTHQLAETLSIIVVDDRSTDATPHVLAQLAPSIPNLTVITSEVNRGHGPTALAAYRAGLALEPDAIVHVDGDGQFVGRDFALLVGGLEAGADVVHGVRQQRTDPWFRKLITGLVGSVVALVVRHRVPDVNTPLRAYRPAVITRLLQECPPNALVPHVHFSLAERRLGFDVRYVRVLSIPRRGGEAHGTMFGRGAVPLVSSMLPSRRLLTFIRSAAAELWRHSLWPARSRRDRLRD